MNTEIDDEEDSPDENEAADALASYQSSSDDEALPEHKRAGYAERMYDAADSRRKAQREDAA